MLVESVELTRYRWGRDCDLTAGGDAAAGMLLILLGEYSRAEDYCREAAVFRSKDSPEAAKRFWADLHFGISLLGQKKYVEARSPLLSAYHGLRPRDRSAMAGDARSLRWIVEEILRLRDSDGRPLHSAALAKLRVDPGLLGIVFDPEFPTDPFGRELERD